MLLPVAVLSACGGDDDKKTPLEKLGIACATVETVVDENIDTDKNLKLTLTGTFVSDSPFDSGAAEIVSYDTCTDQLFLTNASSTLDVLRLSDTDSTPAKTAEITLAEAGLDASVTVGSANSVAAHKGLIAVAVEAQDPQSSGFIALFRADTRALINTYPAGAMPDMVTFSPDGRYIVSANEGEPSGDYSNDPAGTVTIVDISAGFSDEQALVAQVGFGAFNSGSERAAELPSAVRLGPGSSVARNLEPEYVAIDAASATAWVTLQENNAVAVIDLASASVTAIAALGGKPWDAASGNTLDASDKDQVIGNFRSYEQLTGLYMPDAIATVTLNGETYLITANEGDGREYIYTTSEAECDDAGHDWDGGDDAEGDCISYTDEARGKDIAGKVAADHPLKAALSDPGLLARLKVTDDKDSYAAGDNITAFGARSFSVWNSAGELVYDSGDVIADELFNYRFDRFSDTDFNADNDSNFLLTTGDSRSDDKGSEPEAVEVATFGDRSWTFIGLERQSGVMAFEITNPEAPVFNFYATNRDFTENVCTTSSQTGDCEDATFNPAAGDLGPESVDYFSRLGRHFIAVANEVSGTVSVWEITFEEGPIL
tara:strand:- start:15244 stop:17049 length:1806 start_codon:yes stop_codon:yes gene_type:complete